MDVFRSFYKVRTVSVQSPQPAESSWLLQVMIIPISQASREYADQVRSRIRRQRFFVDVDHGDSKMEKKIREAQLSQYNYILVRHVSSENVQIPIF